MSELFSIPAGSGFELSSLWQVFKGSPLVIFHPASAPARRPLTQGGAMDRAQLRCLELAVFRGRDGSKSPPGTLSARRMPGALPGSLLARVSRVHTGPRSVPGYLT